VIKEGGDAERGDTPLLDVVLDACPLRGEP
jgi:hypothetical protein